MLARHSLAIEDAGRRRAPVQSFFTCLRPAFEETGRRQAILQSFKIQPMETRPSKKPIYPHLFRDLLIAEVKRRLFEESIPRLKKCLDQLTEEEVWQRPNKHSNSMGNLVLHLEGNIRQWVLSGLAKEPDVRKRQAEFEEQGPIPKAKLLAGLEKTMEEVGEALDRIQPEDLMTQHEVQVFHESGLSILIHVVEHFSYHVGQLTYYVKALKNVDMDYYRGMELE